MLLREVSHIGCCASNGEAVGGIGTHLCAILRPVAEGVAVVSRSSQSSSATVIIGTCACDGAACGRVGSSGDGITVLREDGNVGRIGSGCETVGTIGAHLCPILRPLAEGVARVGRGGQGDGAAFVVGARARDGAARSRVGRGRDGVGVDLRRATCGVHAEHDLVVGGDITAAIAARRGRIVVGIVVVNTQRTIAT